MTETGRLERLAALETRIVARAAVCRDHVAIEVVAERFPSSDPGQFVQVQCASAAASQSRVVEWSECGFPTLPSSDPAFLRRPFSIADQWIGPDGHTHLVVISRNVGRGTAWLERVHPGQTLNVTGPLGHGFTIPQQDVPLVLIGGGVGIPPLLYLTRRLHDLNRRDVTLILGATRRDLFPVALRNEPDPHGRPTPCLVLPAEADFPALVTTDDGSLGMPGLVTHALAAWQARRAIQSAQVFACGPEGMLKALADQTRRLGLACQLCIERNMGCGLGTCLSCVVRRRDRKNAQGWSWALACLDGPVFERDQLIDYNLPASR